MAISLLAIRSAAAQVLRLVLPVAILGANLPTLERAQLLTQAAEGLSKAGAPDAALEAAVPGGAHHRPVARLAARGAQPDVFNQLVRLAADLGDDAFRQQMNDSACNRFLASSGIMVTSWLHLPNCHPTMTQRWPRSAPCRAAATLLADRIADWRR